MIFIDQKLFKDDISVIFVRFSSIKHLSITENLANAKLLVFSKLLTRSKILAAGKILADGELFSVDVLIEMVTDLTYMTFLPDLPIDEKLD